jgi:hypothetical protein
LELIFEVLGQVLVWLAEVFAELLIQLLGETIADLFEYKVAERRSQRGLSASASGSPPTFWQALGKALIYTLLGALMGWLSTLVFPHLFIRSQWLQWVYIAVSPVLAALAMVWLGSWRRRRDQPAIGLDQFMYAYCFALSMAVIRNAYAA